MRAFITILLMGLAFKATPQVVMAEYFFDNAKTPYGQGISLNVPVNSGAVQISEVLSVSDLSPGFHQVFFRVKDSSKGWSPLTPKAFLKPWPLDTIEGFRYCIDGSSGSPWIYKAFPDPSASVDFTFDIELGDLAKRVHYIEAMSRTKSGAWTPISSGIFFNLYSEPLNITSLEYYFEDDNSILSPLYAAGDFLPSPSVSLDSVSFAIPFSSLENMESYFIFIRGVDEKGNRGPFMKDTIFFHAAIGIYEQIYLSTEFMVYPNPAGESVNLKFVNLSNKNKIPVRFIDLTGRVVMEEKIDFIEKGFQTISIATLPAGAYQIVILTEGGNMIARASFVKK